MKFIEQMKKEPIVEHTAEPPETRSEWEALKIRMDKKFELAKGTSIILRGKQEANSQGLRQLDLDEMPATRKIGIVDDLGPDRNSQSLLKQIKDGTISAKELKIDERRIVVKALKESGKTLDEIADYLQVGRRTIVSDAKWLREAASREIKELDPCDLAGEVYAIGSACVTKALSDGLCKTASYVMKDMVDMLQSMGVVYKAPQQLRSMQLTGHLPVARVAFTKYMETISGEEDRVIAVLDRLMSGIENGEID